MEQHQRTTFTADGDRVTVSPAPHLVVELLGLEALRVPHASLRVQEQDLLQEPLVALQLLQRAAGDLGEGVVAGDEQRELVLRQDARQGAQNV